MWVDFHQQKMQLQRSSRDRNEEGSLAILMFPVHLDLVFHPNIWMYMFLLHAQPYSFRFFAGKVWDDYDYAPWLKVYQHCVSKA